MTYRAGPRRWIPQVGNSHVARQISNTLAVLEDLGGHAIALALEYPAAGGAGRNAARILAAVLQVVQALVQVNRRVGARRVGEDEPENATHGCRIWVVISRGTSKLHTTERSDERRATDSLKQHRTEVLDHTTGGQQLRSVRQPTMGAQGSW